MPADLNVVQLHDKAMAIDMVGSLRRAATSIEGETEADDRSVACVLVQVHESGKVQAGVGPVYRRGDAAGGDRDAAAMIVRIGPATLYRGDAYAIRPTLGFHDADVLDPPYTFVARGGSRYRARRPMFDQIVSEGLHRGFDMAIVNPLLCGAAIVFSHNDQLAELLTRVQGQFHRHALCVWQKTNPQPIANKHYRPDAEFYVHAWNRGYHPGGDMAELLRISRISSPRGAARYNHPTTKPDALMAKIVANVAGTSICDPFMGTGSTGVAAVRAGRRFSGIEHNPQHFDVAVERIRAAIGGEVTAAAA